MFNFFLFFRYNELQNNNKILKKPDLEIELKKISDIYEGIFNTTEDDLKNEEFVLEKLKEIEEEYEKLVKDSSNSITKIDNETSSLQAKLLDLENRENILYKECTNKISYLQEVQRSNLSILQDMEQMIVKQQSPPLFIYQYPLHEFVSKCQNFGKIFNLLIKKNFRSEDSMELTTEEYDIDEYIKKMEIIRKRYIDSYPRYIQAMRGYKSRENVIKSINTWNLNSFNYDHIQNQILILNKESDELSQYENVLMNEINNLIEKMTDQKFELLMFDVNEMKIKRSNKRKHLMEEILHSSNVSLRIAEFMLILMKNDFEYFDNFNKYSKYELNLTFENEVCQRRIVSIFL